MDAAQIEFKTEFIRCIRCVLRVKGNMGLLCADIKYQCWNTHCPKVKMFGPLKPSLVVNMSMTEQSCLLTGH